jgi:hypothetical protein
MLYIDFLNHQAAKEIVHNSLILEYLSLNSLGLYPESGKKPQNG